MLNNNHSSHVQYILKKKMTVTQEHMKEWTGNYIMEYRNELNISKLDTYAQNNMLKY